MRISDWSSDVCSSDLVAQAGDAGAAQPLDAGDGVGHGGHLGADLRGRGQPILRAIEVTLLRRDLGAADHRAFGGRQALHRARRSEEHTSELQSLMRITYAVFCLKKKKSNDNNY